MAADAAAAATGVGDSTAAAATVPAVVEARAAAAAGGREGRVSDEPEFLRRVPHSRSEQFHRGEVVAPRQQRTGEE